MRRALPLVLVVALLAGLVPLAVRVATARAATTFVVNHAGDAGDVNHGDGLCDVSFFSQGPQCSLRAAIQEANAAAGADTIRFAIPGGGVQTIRPASELPRITAPVTIDGYSQRPCATTPAPCSRPNTIAAGTNAQLLIELDGSNTGDGVSGRSGLRILAPNVEVHGLAINRFGREGIEVQGEAATGALIQGCFLGTDPTGTQSLGNFDGVTVANGATATVGGATPAARNLISGNSSGVAFFGGGPGSRVQGNLIGTDKTGRAALSNGSTGVLIFDTDNAAIGGDSAAAANVIAFNGRAGVHVTGDEGTGNRILGNSIFANAGLGIDLAGSGVTANDPLDADVGPNTRQNFPELTAATRGGGVTTVTGRLRSSPSRAFVREFVVQVFSSASGRQGQTFRGQLVVATDVDGVSPEFRFRSPTAIPIGHRVTATATDRRTGDTSEFSRRPVVVAG